MSAPPYVVEFFIKASDELATAVQTLDEDIATANRRDVEVVLPGRERSRQRAEEQQAQRGEEQRQLDDVASQLPPPA